MAAESTTIRVLEMIKTQLLAASKGSLGLSSIDVFTGDWAAFLAAHSPAGGGVLIKPDTNLSDGTDAAGTVFQETIGAEFRCFDGSSAGIQARLSGSVRRPGAWAVAEELRRILTRGEWSITPNSSASPVGPRDVSVGQLTAVLTADFSAVVFNLTIIIRAEE